VFPKERICRGLPTACPSRSSDLNSFGFYLLEHLRSTAHSKEVSDLQDLRQRKN
jgi:hypothetical protein